MYNVLREAAPNIQTPVIQGDSLLILSEVDPKEVAKLTEVKTDYSKIIQDANLKSRESLAVKNLDTSLVNLYKRFSQAIEENRIFRINDNEDNDCAMSNYEKLEKAKLPDQVFQIIKRKLAVAIMSDIVDRMATVASQGKAFPDIPTGYIRIIPEMLDRGLNIIGQNHPSASNILLLKNTHKIMTRLGNPKHQPDVKKELLGLVANDPKYPHYQVLLAHTYLRMNDLDSAIFYFEKVKKLLPNQVYSEINIADAYLRNQQLEKAVNYYQKAIDQDSTIAEAYHKLMTVYWQQKNYPNVLSLGEKTISLTRNSDKTPMNMQWGNSMRRYTSLDRIFRVHYMTANKAKIIETINRYEQCAKEDYNKLYDDSYYWAITHLAHVCWDDTTGQWQKPIIQATDRMIAIVKSKLVKSKNKEAQVQDWRILGAYYHYIGQNKLAERYLKDAVRIYEDESHSVGVRYLPKTRKLAAFWLDTIDSYLELCILAIEKGNLKEALQWLEKSMTKGCKRKDLYQSPHIIPELHNLAEYKALMIKYFPQKTPEKK